MKYRKLWAVAIIITFVITACSGQKIVSGQDSGRSLTTSAKDAGSQANQTESDTQGAVTVAVTPENLDNPGDTLIFDVSMNTHTVDLSMNLSQLAVLTTDTGKTVEAIGWDAKMGGHHVNGKLSFPLNSGGESFLDGAGKITLTIMSVDAAARTFTWQVTG